MFDSTRVPAINRSCDDVETLWGTIQPGTILIEEGAFMPESLRLANTSGAEGWKSVEPTDRRELERNIRDAGSIFYFKTEEITATAFGFDPQKAVRTALQRVVAAVKVQRCNCLQISQMTAKSFLRILYVSVSAHLRHIQECPTGRPLKDLHALHRRQRRNLADSATVAGA